MEGNNTTCIDKGPNLTKLRQSGQDWSTRREERQKELSARASRSPGATTHAGSGAAGPPRHSSMLSTFIVCRGKPNPKNPPWKLTGTLLAEHKVLQFRGQNLFHWGLDNTTRACLKERCSAHAQSSPGTSNRAHGSAASSLWSNPMDIFSTEQSLPFRQLHWSSQEPTTPQLWLKQQGCGTGASASSCTLLALHVSHFYSTTHGSSREPKKE